MSLFVLLFHALLYMMSRTVQHAAGAAAASFGRPSHRIPNVHKQQYQSNDRYHQYKDQKQLVPDSPPRTTNLGLHVNSKLPLALKNLGINAPTPLQKELIPVLNSMLIRVHRVKPCPRKLNMHRDTLFLHGEKGAGKTTAYLVPVIEQILHNKHPHACEVNTIILVSTESDTRRLKSTIQEIIESLGTSRYMRTPTVSSTFFGENAVAARERLAHEAPDILITTPASFLRTYAKHFGDKLPFVRTLESDLSDYLVLDSMFNNLRCIVLDDCEGLIDPPSRFAGKVKGNHIELLYEKNKPAISILNTLLQLGDPVLVFSSCAINNRFFHFCRQKGWTINEKLIRDPMLKHQTFSDLHEDEEQQLQLTSQV